MGKIIPLLMLLTLFVTLNSCQKNETSSTTSSTPTITSFTPTSGSVGTLVTITGTNLQSITALSIGGVPATIVSITGSQLVGMVMPGTTTGVISVTSAEGSSDSKISFTLSSTTLPFAQQGSKVVVVTGKSGDQMGGAVAVSADGNTAIVTLRQSGELVFTRSGTTWSQQGSELITIAVSDSSGRENVVALSADGNTAIVGDCWDNHQRGAVWIFTRSGGIWSQQGNKLVGTDNYSHGNQGRSVSLSADGNTAIVGGYYDNGGIGAAWVYTRTGTSWSQQGSKLVGTGNIGAAKQGSSVSLSADGNTAIIGGNYDNGGQGAVWAFTRSGATWSQQGSKFVGTGNTGAAKQGTAVSLSADGNSAIVGGSYDDWIGAVWVYTRTGTSWSQQGSKLVGTGSVGSPQLYPVYQGSAVSLSGDGTTAIIGGSGDNHSHGAFWVFVN